MKGNPYLPTNINVDEESNAYDNTIDILKTIDLSRPVVLSPDIFIDTTNVAIGTTNYYPSSDGLILFGKNPSFQMRVICNTTGIWATNASTWFERSDEPDGVTPVKWYLCTELGVISSYSTNVTDTSLYIGATGFKSFIIDPSEYFEVTIDFNNFRGYRIRNAMVTDVSASNTVYISCIQQPLEG
jgi:hypothetical protein